MGMDPITLAMLGTSAFSAYQQYEAGVEAKQSYYDEAAEVKRRSAYGQRMALEEMKEVGAEGRSAESKAVASAGGSGLRAGGSVMTLAQSIQRDVARRKALIGFQSGEETRRSLWEAGRLREAGRAAKKAAGYQAFGSLLTGGLQAWGYQSQLGGGSKKSGKMTNEGKATLLRY